MKTKVLTVSGVRQGGNARFGDFVYRHRNPKSRARLEKKGQMVGGNDLLIAAQAISLGFTLVTANKREFAKLQDLRCENWLGQVCS